MKVLSIHSIQQLKILNFRLERTGHNWKYKTGLISLAGLDRTKKDWTRLNRTAQNCIGLDRLGQTWIIPDWT